MPTSLVIDAPPADWRPLVSVVCPVRNERGSIDQVLDALEAQTYPAELLEVLVVDGASEDGTAERVRERASSSPVAIRVLDNPERTTPQAMNIGIEAATGALIVLVGGHTIVAEDFVDRNVDAHRQTAAAVTGGRIDTIGSGPEARAIAIAQSSRFGVGAVAFRTVDEGSMEVDTVAYGAYRREVFDAIGLFDEELVRNQDDEFNFRLEQAGGRIWFDARIRSTYQSRATLRRLVRQYHDYGLYKVLVIQKRGAVPAARHLVPAAAVTGLGGASVASLVSGRRWMAGAAFGAYVGGCTAAGLWEGRRDRRAAPLVPLALMSLHLPYGVGFLRGLWRYRDRWGRRT